MNTTYICVCIYTPMNIKYVCVFTIGYSICVCACMPLNIIQSQKKVPILPLATRDSEDRM